MEIKRTIEDVYDVENGVEIKASQFFKQPFDVITQARSMQELANQGKRDKWLVCYTCGENIRILGGKSYQEILKPGKNFHFAHLHNSKDCPIKTTSNYSREDINRMQYRGIAEGKPHIELKEKLYQGLNFNASHKGQVSALQLEQVIRSLEDSEWRKPDINLLLNGRRLAVELQLSTTWLDVIVGRQAFYRQEGIFILWVFNEFDYKDSSRKLAFSDIIYTNNYNAFIFDEEARAATIRENDLVLKCYFQHHYIQGDRVLSQWENQLVTLEQLTFDERSMKIYYRDIGLEKHNAAESVRKLKAKQQKDKEDQRRERNRLRYVRSGYQENHQKMEKSLAEARKAIEKLERQLKETRADLANSQKDLLNVTDKAKEISGRLAGYWWALPAATESLKNELKQKQEQINAEIKNLEDLLTKLTAKDQYYRKGRAIRIDGKDYHVLDRTKNWEFVIQQANRILAYRNDQANSLFATPELQPLNSHKVMQMRHNLQVEFVIDLSAEFSANTTDLSGIAQLLQQSLDRRSILESEAPVLIEQSLKQSYAEKVKVSKEQVVLLQKQLEAHQHDQQRFQEQADMTLSKISELDYLDDYDDEDSY